MSTCNHSYAATYKHKPPAMGHRCAYPEFFDRVRSTAASAFDAVPVSVLPIDDAGACLFHSQQIAWKRENDFTGKFLQLVQMLDMHDAERYYDFAEFVFLGSGLRTKSDAKEHLLRLVDTSFGKQAYFTGASFIDPLELERVEFHDGASFDQALFLHDVTFDRVRIKGLDVGAARFTDATFFRGVEFLNFALFANASFTTTNISPLVLFENSRFEGITDFSGADFTLGDQSAVCFRNVQFEDVADFRNTHFNCQVEFTDVSFADTTDFIDTSFDLVSSSARYRGTAVEFNRIQLTATAVLSFMSTDVQKKMFDHDVQISFKEDPLGTVRFENVNFSRFTPSSKERLLQLAKLGSVEIGSGCIKYRFQTDVQTISVSQGNAPLILELCQTFTNYFSVSNGLNLGFEIVERDKTKVSFFYFTDEDISEETFRERLEQTERSLWDLLSISSEEQLVSLKGPTGSALSTGKESAVINAVDAISALLGTFFRVGTRIALGTWKEADTVALLNAIPVNQERVSSRATNLHRLLVDKYTRRALFDLSSGLNHRLFLEGKVAALDQTVKLLADKGATYVMGDKYEVTSKQVGGLAVGPNAQARDITLNQIVNQIEQTMDFSQLADELSRLSHAMSQEASETEQYIAIGEVAKAEQAAKTKDSTKVGQSLKLAGGWALDVATKIGVSLASEALKHSLGMK